MRAGTIVASNYSAMARVLGQSFLDHHRDSTFTVLVVDDEPCDLPDRISIARLADLDIDESDLDTMKSIYDVMEFSTAVKPSFLRLLLASGDALGGGPGGGPDGGPDGGPVACYLDPDIEVFANFDDCVVDAHDHGIVLTPHVLTPVPRDGMKVSEGTIMQSGMYNCGFLAVGDAGREFLDWWDERLRFDAVVDFEQSHFTDQRWVDWVPSLFDFSICRDPGMNVAWWNGHERPIDLSGDRPSTLGVPIRFVHFSGYDPANPDLLSKHQVPAPRVAHVAGTGMRTLADDYGARLVALGHVERRRSPYQWNVSVDGVELTTEVRRRLRSAMLDEIARTGCRTETPDAFGGGSMPLSQWLTHEGPDPSRVIDAHEGPDPSRGGAIMSGSSASEIVRRARGVMRRVRSLWERLLHGAAERVRRTGNSARLAGGPRPFAFLHVPKSAGSSVTTSLREALDGHTWGEFLFDPAWMGPYRDAERPESAQGRVLESRAHLASVDAVAGHLTLDTLLSRFAIDDVATVVREPRCRLLSHYEFWRNLDDDARAADIPWTSSHSARTLDFADWLLDESIAYQSDNTLIRQLVDDPVIPDNEFIPNDQLARLARIASARIRQLGFVGLVESGDAVFDRLGEFVGAPLRHHRINVTEREPSLGVDLEAIFERAVPALAARTAGDALVWQAAARRVGVADPDVLAESAWMHRVGATVRNDAAG